MTEIAHERGFRRPDPGTSAAVKRPGILGSAALLTVLAGCAGTEVQGQFFDYQSATVQGSESTSAKAGANREQPTAMSASALLGTFQTGSNYTVNPTVTSNGRYNTYTFETERGAYSVTGDAVARKHIQELTALDALTKYSPPAEFAQGVGSAVADPAKGVFTAVTDPVGASKATYANVERRFKSVQRGMSQAGEFVTTMGKPEKKRPGREDENLLEKIVDRPKEKRRLARALGVDPYTHFVPLSNELNKMASYSAAGTFGVKRAISFVPGGAGTVISGIGTFDSLTARALDMAPDETAAVNRERLQKLNITESIIKKFLLNDKLTPTEKTQAVGYFVSLSDTPGLENIVSFVAETDTRHDALSAFQALHYISTQSFGNERIVNTEIIHGVPVLTLGGSRKIAVFTSDYLFWAPPGASQISSLNAALRGDGRGAPKREIWVSGSISGLAKRQLQRQGWIVKTNIVNNSYWHS
jgi:hypothetical protein